MQKSFWTPFSSDTKEDVFLLRYVTNSVELIRIVYQIATSRKIYAISLFNSGCSHKFLLGIETGKSINTCSPVFTPLRI